MQTVTVYVEEWRKNVKMDGLSWLDTLPNYHLYLRRKILDVQKRDDAKITMRTDAKLTYVAGDSTFMVWHKLGDHTPKV